MEIQGFRIKNFRNVIDSGEIALRGYTAIIGKNGSGKSNLLLGLIYALKIIRAGAHVPLQGESKISEASLFKEVFSDYEDDFPHENFEITIHLKISVEEANSWIQKVIQEPAAGGSISVSDTASCLRDCGEVSIEISVRHSRDEISARTYCSRCKIVISPIPERIPWNRLRIVSIGSNRDDDYIEDIINDQLEQKIHSAQLHDKKLVDLRREIDDFEEKLTNELADRIYDRLERGPIRVSKIFFRRNKAKTSSPLPRSIRERYRKKPSTNSLLKYILVDDGAVTQLKLKSSGYKSVLAISLVHDEEKEPVANLSARLFAVEEPESHLHPGAAREVASMLRSIGQDRRVLITTHSPLFLNYENLEQNYLIEDGLVKPVTTVASIRRSLGIPAQDNLLGAGVKIGVEGRSDQIVWGRLIREIVKSGEFRALPHYFDSGLVRIESLEGSGEARKFLSSCEEENIQVYFIFDSDEGGANGSGSSAVYGRSYFPLPQGKNLEFLYSRRIIENFLRQLKLNIDTIGFVNKWFDEYREDSCDWEKFVHQEIYHSIAEGKVDRRSLSKISLALFVSNEPSIDDIFHDEIIKEEIFQKMSNLMNDILSSLTQSSGDIVTNFDS